MHKWIELDKVFSICYYGIAYQQNNLVHFHYLAKGIAPMAYISYV